MWLSKDQVTTLSGNGIAVYSDAGMLIRHIEVILRRHLNHFLGLQEVETLLEAWSEDGALASSIDAALPDAAARLGFARLLRTLVREQTPITEVQEILSAIEGLSLDADGIATAVRVVRLRIKASLPANAGGIRHAQLPLELENLATSWLTRQDGRIRFNTPPQVSHKLLRDIRKLIPSGDEPSVLVVRDPELRPFLQRMVDFSLPFLMVQSREELLKVEQPFEQVPSAEAEAAETALHV